MMPRRLVFVLVGLGVFTFLFAGYTTSMLWPVTDLWIEPQNDMPVLNADTDGHIHTNHISIKLSFCNNDVDVVQTRWLDQYEQFSVFEAESSEPLGAVEIGRYDFYPPGPQCGVDQVINVPLPTRIPDGIYRYRAANSYNPWWAPWRTVNVHYETEPFELARHENEE